MGNPDEKPTSHGQGGDTKPTPAPQHKSYGSDKRDEVAGGPAGRGNDTGATVDTSGDWGRGDKQDNHDPVPEDAKPVAGESGTSRNAFSKP